MAEKVPLARLLVTAPPDKKGRKRKPEEERTATKKSLDKARGQTRINIGVAFERWRELRELKGLTSDAEVALYLLDSESSYHPPTMTSPDRAEQETPVQSCDDGTEKEDVQRQKSPDKQPENKDDRDDQQDEDQEFTTSLSVGDGRFLVDLGSSSEFIVDEECILQLFRSCRRCNKQCTVRKSSRGLKVVVSQACWSCHHRCKWTNLPSDDED